MNRRVAAIVAALAFAAGPAAAADNPHVTLAVPASATDFAFAYVADGLGLWKKNGIDVTVSLIPGLGSANAVFGGSVEFTASSGGTAIAAIVRGQKPMVVGSVRTKLPFDIVVSKAIADSVDLNADFATRAKALKGKIIAVDRPATFQDGFAKYVLAKAGLDPLKDATYTPIVPPAMPAALEAGKIDAFSAAPPWTTLAVQKGFGFTLISPSTKGDIPEISTIGAMFLIARGDYCQKNADTCRKFLAGVKAAMEVIDQNPDQAFDVIKAKFQDMDPDLLKVGFADTRAAYNPSLETTEEQMVNAQILSLQAGALKPEEKHEGSFAEFYSNDYVK